MSRFYFTHGLEGMPFCGGWTEVIADTLPLAVAAYSAYHPGKSGCVDCSMVYTEPEFESTRMYKKGNFGKRCQEVIYLSKETKGE